MKRFALAWAAVLFITAAADAGAASVYDFLLEDIDGKTVSLRDFHGDVLLIVNTASRCGFTYQFEGLEALFKKYRDRGLVILGFPSNDFLGQEPGTNQEIKSFCTLSYGVSFPMFSKIRVTGSDIHPLYKYLTGKDTNPHWGGAITWNFNKFLVGRDGAIIGRFRTEDEPQGAALLSAVEAALGACAQPRSP